MEWLINQNFLIKINIWINHMLYIEKQTAGILEYPMDG